MNKFITVNKVQRKTERVIDLITENGEICGVKTESGNEYFADSVIVATGGLSYPKTGSSGDGYKLAQKVGHTVTELRPSLSALVCREGLCSECMGLSLKNVSIKVVDTKKKKEIYDDFGEMLFTHFGMSGPIVLSASSLIDRLPLGSLDVSLDLKPALDEQTLDKRLLRDFEKLSKKKTWNFEET